MVSRVYVEKKPGFDVEAKQLLAELRTILQIEALTGVRPTLIRYPFGEYDDHVITAIRDLGMEPIQWDVEPPATG